MLLFTTNYICCDTFLICEYWVFFHTATAKYFFNITNDWYFYWWTLTEYFNNKKKYLTFYFISVYINSRLHGKCLIVFHLTSHYFIFIYIMSSWIFHICLFEYSIMPYYNIKYLLFTQINGFFRKFSVEAFLAS